MKIRGCALITSIFFVFKMVNTVFFRKANQGDQGQHFFFLRRSAKMCRLGTAGRRNYAKYAFFAFFETNFWEQEYQKEYLKKRIAIR